jgi:hypothetical protein
VIPSVLMAFRLADALGVKLDDLRQVSLVDSITDDNQQEVADWGGPVGEETH